VIGAGITRIACRSRKSRSALANFQLPEFVSWPWLYQLHWQTKEITMSSIEMKAKLPVMSFADDHAMDHWIQHSGASGVWIKFAKKESGILSLGRSQALDLALCHGWIDGQADKYDANYYVMRFTPRRARSLWSQINCARIERLEAENRMRPGGIMQVEAAKADGRWQCAYPPPSATQLPDDIAEALSANPAASVQFAALSKSKRYMLLHGIAIVKKQETRARKILEMVSLLSDTPT
jgi:uncharacterized protein YdeI (YjbR/CyaY-like superfamily)